MTLNLFPLTIDLALMMLALVAGFWLGRRHRVSALRNHEHDLPRAAENELVIDEPSLPVTAEEAGPQREPLPQPFESEVPPARLATDFKVMIVDDEPINIQVTQEYLKLAGYQNIIGVSDSRTVLSRISQVQPDVVLLDIMMPEVSGLEILERIRAEGQWAYLPVIVVTASDNEQTKVQALELGATDFLGKPVNGTELVPRVRNATAGQGQPRLPEALRQGVRVSDAAIGSADRPGSNRRADRLGKPPRSRRGTSTPVRRVPTHRFAALRNAAGRGSFQDFQRHPWPPSR